MNAQTKKIAAEGTYGTHIIQYPSGRYGFVGSIPKWLLDHTHRGFHLMEAAESFFNELAKRHS